MISWFNFQFLDKMSDQNEQPEVFSDASNRLAAAESPTKSQPNSQGILKRGARKSLGRRVSFAATAHVRVFNEAEAENVKSGGDVDAEEDEMAAFRRQFEGEAESESLKNSFEEFGIKSSPMASTNSFEGIKIIN